MNIKHCALGVVRVSFVGLKLIIAHYFLFWCVIITKTSIFVTVPSTGNKHALMKWHCIFSCSEICKSPGNHTAKPWIRRSYIQVCIEIFSPPYVSYCFAQYQHIPGTDFPLLYTCDHLRCEQSPSSTCQMKPCGFFQQIWGFCGTCQHTFPPPSHLPRRKKKRPSAMINAVESLWCLMLVSDFAEPDKLAVLLLHCEYSHIRWAIFFFLLFCVEGF